MNKSFNFSKEAFKKSFFAFLHRFHILLFVVVVLGGLVVIVFLLNNSIIASGETNDYTPTTNSTTFDQATMKRIEDLKTKDQSNTDINTSGRVNPFVE